MKAHPLNGFTLSLSSRRLVLILGTGAEGRREHPFAYPKRPGHGHTPSLTLSGPWTKGKFPGTEPVVPVSRRDLTYLP